MGEHQGGIRGLLHRLTSDESELDAEQLRERVDACGATQAVDAVDRELVTLRGILRTVTLRPRAGTPALEAELYDGSGSVTIVFLGRRRIAGIDPGRTVQVRGRLTTHNGHPAVYNPVYELLP
ncbi:MAG: hypothetical protein QOK42_910 [Frankiaceae bacterium]|jgi:hypothetical protein|nr:hypothetical protein [Frankiaceae bacterium]MDX6225561.1 hypothetical protein [Frankiales bacterium]MDX6275431.1 hypothetical protein [Frankiales bacterium]